ncbi:hypothetical protein [Streptomyces zaomyceticus]|uniref:hypothetical protein n=1 Tax=Streptomyces zaomyceticus TaxID=68286 RepID=UPI0036A6C448
MNITQPSEITLSEAVFEDRARRGGAPLALKAIQGLPATQTDTSRDCGVLGVLEHVFVLWQLTRGLVLVGVLASRVAAVRVAGNPRGHEPWTCRSP